MGTLLSCILLIAGMIAKDQALIVSSGLFAIAGAIEYCGYKRKGESDDE